MKTKILIFSLLLQTFSALEVHDRRRKCPSGYHYYGEVDISDLPTRDYWLEGPRSPTYSCYRQHQGSMDWIAAYQKCSEYEGEVLSVENPGEEAILTGEKAMRDLVTNQTLLTSGISLAQDSWAWLGAGENISNPDILGMLEMANSSNTQCVWVDWTRTADGNFSLSYYSQDCMAPSASVICEVRVYTQTWYYWATANWLQILFCLTLILLIISSCVTVSMYSSSPRSRRSSPRPTTEISSSPPPYTPHDTNIKTSNKYAEKGKELLAKIVFYRQSEDKQKLTPDA